MKYIKTYAPLFLTASLVIALDQWTKWLVRENILVNTSWLPENLYWLMPYARLVHVYNDGMAFGMLQGAGFAWVFAVLALVVTAAIFYFYNYADNWWMRLALGMQMAGALGNLIDRLTLGGFVTDFISVGSFPVFNVADASITVGTAMLLLAIWIMERAEARQKQETVSAVEEESMPEEGAA